MENFHQTQRDYKEYGTNEVFSLFHDSNTGAFKLAKTKENASFDYPEGTEVNGWIINTNETDYKHKDGTIITLKNGYFLPRDIDNHITHYKYTHFDKYFKKFKD